MSRVMTYAEIATEFGINRRSAEQLVRRKHWARRKGNDGKARVEVPEDAFPPSRETLSEALSEAPPVTPSEGTSEAPSDTPSEVPSEGARDLLKHLVERLEAEVAELRPKAIAHDALVMVVNELRQDRDDWKAQAQRLALLVPAPNREEELLQERDYWREEAERLAVPAPVPARRRWWWRRSA